MRLQKWSSESSALRASDYVVDYGSVANKSIAIVRRTDFSTQFRADSSIPCRGQEANAQRDTAA